MRKLLITLGGALFAVSTVGGVAYAKNPNAQGSGGQGRGPDLERVGGRNTTPGTPRGRGPDIEGRARRGLCNAFSHNSDQAKAHGLPFRRIAAAGGCD